MVSCKSSLKVNVFNRPTEKLFLYYTPHTDLLAALPPIAAKYFVYVLFCNKLNVGLVNDTLHCASRSPLEPNAKLSFHIVPFFVHPALKYIFSIHALLASATFFDP
jgi:hypothetical protein